MKNSADRKAQIFTDPETGKRKIRMVPVDRDVVKDKESKRKVSMDEAVDTNRLKQLARLGLVDKADYTRLLAALKKLESGKELSIQEKNVIIGMVYDLISIVTGDTTTFQKAKKEVSGK